MVRVASTAVVSQWGRFIRTSFASWVMYADKKGAPFLQVSQATCT